jgi:hypothetical protein
LTPPVPDVLLLLVALGGLLIMVALVAVLVRGRDRAAANGSIPTHYRTVGTLWRRGALRFDGDGDGLSLRGPGGLSVGPWTRGNLDLGVAGALSELECRRLGRGRIIRVPVSYGRTTFELALEEQHYTALRAWVEAAPPGWNSQVA